VLYQLSYTGIGMAFSIGLRAAATGIASLEAPRAKNDGNFYSARRRLGALAVAYLRQLWTPFARLGSLPHNFASSPCNPSISGTFRLE
jgi:hypothetical protein